MNFILNHWVDIGGFLILFLSVFLFFEHPNFNSVTIIVWLSFISLLIHQLEEYRFPGYFPYFLNKNFFKSTIPDRYPLNTKSAFIVNVCFGWTIYLAAIVFLEKFIWIAIASIMISLGNILMHTLIFNLKGKTIYNPGMISSLIFFLPITICFFFIIQKQNLAKPGDYLIGITLGLVFSYIGILKMIDWLKDRQTENAFLNHP